MVMVFLVFGALRTGALSDRLADSWVAVVVSFLRLATWFRSSSSVIWWTAFPISAKIGASEVGGEDSTGKLVVGGGVVEVMISEVIGELMECGG